MIIITKYLLGAVEVYVDNWVPTPKTEYQLPKLTEVYPMLYPVGV